jgi:ribosomal protein S18 acetylase RimI-like enzyme
VVALVSMAALLEPQVLDPFRPAPRAITAADVPELADLYQLAYAGKNPQPDAETAHTNISAVFDGVRGALIPAASLLTHDDAQGGITAAIIITERTFRSDKPPTPFIAQLFTHPHYRRQGLAESLLSHAMQALHESGYKTLAVTVNSSNAPAMALYLSRDFRRFTPPITGND